MSLSFEGVISLIFDAGLPSAFCHFFGEGQRRLDTQKGHRDPPQDLSSPMPCGLPFAAPVQGPPKSGRRRQRWFKTQRSRSMINSLVAYLSWLSVGRPAGGPAAQVLACELTPVQLELVADLQSRIAGVCRSSEMLPSLDGGLSTLQDSLTSISTTGYHNTTMAMFGSPPKSLTPYNMSVPDVAAILPLDETRLPKVYANIVACPELFDLEPHEWPTELPGMCMSVSNWPDVACKLWDVALVNVVADLDIPRWQGLAIRAGLFGVGKKLSELLRIIIDKRRKNACEKALLRVLLAEAHRCNVSDDELAMLLRLYVLPHASQFVDFFLPRPCVFSINLDDAQDYYYYMAWPENVQCHNIVGWPIAADELIAAGARRDVQKLLSYGSQSINLGLTAPAMGDHKAPGIAQVVHAHALREGGGLRDSRWMSFGWAPPSDPIWQAPYIDDGAIVGACASPSGCPDPTRDEIQAELNRSHASYDRIGVKRKQAKEIRDAENGIVWGGELSSIRHDVGGEVRKVKQLMMVTARVILLGGCQPHQMMQLTSTWVHHLAFRRPCMSLLDNVYSWMRTPPYRPFTWRRLTWRVVDELVGLVLLWPLMRTDVSAKLGDTVFASDATLKMGDVSQARISTEEQIWLWSRALRRGGAVSLNTSADDDSEKFICHGSSPRMNCYINGLKANSLNVSVPSVLSKKLMSIFLKLRL